MFENLLKQGLRIAEAKARRKADEIAGRLRDELPKDVSVEPKGDAVALSGKALIARLVLEAGLRFLLARIK